jgi:hypothetical protein
MYYPKHFLLIMSTLLFVVTVACTAQSANSSQPLTDNKTSKTYQFTGHADFPSNLQLSKQSDHITYSAQVSDFAGKIITTVNNTSLKQMELIIPAGDKQYYVTIAAQEESWLDNVTITVNPMNDETKKPIAQDLQVAFIPPSSTCEIWIEQDQVIYLSAQPSTSSITVLALPTNIPFIADARTSDGWYRLTIDNTVGWVNGNIVNVTGDCVGLPVDTMIQTNATSDSTSIAPFDVDRHYFSIDGNQGGRFNNKVSYPNGDGTDVIQLTLSNVPSSRTIGLIMNCRGNGAEALRWGVSQTTTYGCGELLELEFTKSSSDILLTVVLTAVTVQQYAEYQLSAMPIAPVDEDQQVLAIDRNRGGVISQSLSFPNGDAHDVIAVYAHNLQPTSPDNFRQVTFMMECNGFATENLRWGHDTVNMGCGDQFTLNLTQNEAVRYLTVHIPTTVGQSFIEYTLYALPSAPLDDVFWFGVDREFGGSFSESISAPMGDTFDNIQISMSNLTAIEPNHYREMDLTLYCDGFNIENVRWGLPDSPTLLCGQTVTTTFIYSANQQNIDIITLDRNAHSYINYTLVLAPKPILPVIVEPVGN